MLADMFKIGNKPVARSLREKLASRNSAKQR